MTDVERQLRDVFADIDRQVEVPPRAEPDRTRHVHPWSIAAAAAVAIALGIGILSQLDRDEGKVDIAADDIDPSVFDERADAICPELLDRPLGPRFATTEAYLLFIEHRAGLIAAAQARIGGLPAPSDDPRLVAGVLDDLDTADRLNERLARQVAAGELSAAAQTWLDVEQAIEDAFLHLADHGADGCRP